MRTAYIRHYKCPNHNHKSTLLVDEEFGYSCSSCERRVPRAEVEALTADLEERQFEAVDSIMVHRDHLTSLAATFALVLSQDQKIQLERELLNDFGLSWPEIDKYIEDWRTPNDV